MQRRFNFDALKAQPETPNEVKAEKDNIADLVAKKILQEAEKGKNLQEIKEAQAKSIQLSYETALQEKLEREKNGGLPDPQSKIIFPAKAQPLPPEPDAWPLPTCPKAKAKAQFPLSVFPENIRKYLESICSVRQVPADLPGMLALGVIATAAQKVFVVKIGCTHQEPVNLYTLAGLESGEKKSPVFRDLDFPIREAEAEMIENSSKDFWLQKTEFEFKVAKANDLKKEAVKAKDPEVRKKLLAESAELMDRADPPRRYKQLVSGDITPEALATEIYEAYGDLALFDAEGGFFEKINGFYQKNPNCNIDSLLKCHSGQDDLHVIRREREEKVERPALTVCLAVQPLIIQNMLANKQFRGRGLLARFLYSQPESAVGSRFYDVNAAIDLKSKEKYGETVKTIFGLKESEKYVIDLSIKDQCLEIWKDFHDKIEAQLLIHGVLSSIADWANKIPGQVARIAGLLHILDHVNSGSIPREISPDACKRAVILGAYFVSQAKESFEEKIVDPIWELCKKFLPTITRGQPWFTLRYLDSYCRNKKKLLAALEVLESRSIIRKCYPEHKGRGPKPKTAFEANPTCRECSHFCGAFDEKV